MYSGCILIYVSIYLYSFQSTTRRYTPRPWSSEFEDAIGGWGRVNSEMHFEAVSERVWRCNWRLRSSELGAALGGRDRSSLEMHLEAEIEWTSSCTWRPWSREFGDALVAGYDRARLEEYLEVVDLEAVGVRRARGWDSIHRLVNSKPWECDKVTSPLKLSWRPRSSELRAALRGQDRASVEMHLEAEIEWTQRCTLRLWPSEFGDALAGYDRARLEE